MSILDHNSQYDIKKVQPHDDDDDENAFGKCFWFSGSMRKQKKKHLLVKEEKEELIQAPLPTVQLESIPTTIQLESSPPPNDDLNDVSPPLSDDDVDPPKKNGGTFFKLNGSFELDNSDLSDDSEEVNITQQEEQHQHQEPNRHKHPPQQQQQQQQQEQQQQQQQKQQQQQQQQHHPQVHNDSEEGDGGTWFGVSGRHLRAESMANLLMLMDAYQPNEDDEPEIVPETFNEVMEENNSYLDDLDTIPPVVHHEMESVKEDLTKSGNDDQVPDDSSSIDEKLLQDFDAQFFEIEKMAMESFDDLDLTAPNEEKNKAPKKNQLFGMKPNDDYKEPVSSTKPFDNSFVKPKSISTKEPEFSKPSNKTKNISPNVYSKDSDDEEPPQRPSKPTNYIANNRTNNNTDVNKSNNRTDKNSPPSKFTTHSLPNRKATTSSPYNKKKSMDDQTITVSTSSETSKQEYQLGETIHLRVSVRNKNNYQQSKSFDDDVFTKPISSNKNKTTSYNNDKDNRVGRKFPRDDSTDSNDTSPRKAKTSSSLQRRKKVVEEPKSVAERISKFQSLPSIDKVEKLNGEKSYPISSLPSHPTKPSQLVEEELLQEEHVKEDFQVNDDMGIEFINTYLSSTDVQDSTQRQQQEKPVQHKHDIEHQRSRSTPESRTTSSEPPRMLLKRQVHLTSSSSSLLSTANDGNNSDIENNNTNKGFESRSEYDSSEDESNRTKLTRNRSFRRSIIIEDDEVSVRRKKSVGGTSVSVAFIAINKKPGDSGEPAKVTIHQRLKGILNFLDNMVLDDESLGLYYDSVRQLHTVFWDLKGKKDSDVISGGGGDGGDGETLSSALNFLVVHEWPKVMLGCFKKLKASYPHVFVQEISSEVCVIVVCFKIINLNRSNLIHSA